MVPKPISKVPERVLKHIHITLPNQVALFVLKGSSDVSRNITYRLTIVSFLSSSIVLV